jgi:drug/metabolite transporter (DMT)-like permease
LFFAWLAFAAVSFFWGTTYLCIRMALEAFPPVVLLAARFLLSGGVLLAIALARGWRMPRGRELWQTAGQGLLMLGIGNGCLTLAETWIPSGLAALIITLSPFWLVGIDAAMPGGEPLHGPTLAGMLVGFAGVGLLLGPDAFRGPSAALLWKGLLVLQVGNFFWNLGSIIQRRRTTQVHAFVSGAIQQFAVGLAFLLPALFWPGGPIHWNARSTAALLWLIVFGSIVGYNSYIYALERLPVAIVSLYNYINPVVAVLLGWWFYREPFGPREALGMGVIFAGVAIVRRVQSRSRTLAPKAPPREADSV